MRKKMVTKANETEKKWQQKGINFRVGFSQYVFSLVNGPDKTLSPF